VSATGGTSVSVREAARTRRVLVARLDSMGDVIVSGPAIRAIAARARVTLLTGPQGAAAGALLPGVEDVAVWECPWIVNPAPQLTDAHVARLTEIVRSRQLTEAVILTSFHQSPLPLALLLRLAGVQWISGASVDHAGSLLDSRLRPGEELPEDIPEPERAVAIATAAGFPPVDDGRLRLGPLPDTSALTGGKPYIVLHPGAAVPARRWPVKSFARTAALLAAAGNRVVVTGGPAERATAAAVCLAARAAGASGEAVVNLAGACSLAELAGVIAGADAIVVGNTGPAHLAAAVGTPVVSLFAPVVPAVRWAPYRVPVALFGDQDAPCRGTRARACPVPGHPCLAGVPAEDVAAAAIRFAGENARTPAGQTAAASRTAQPGSGAAAPVVGQTAAPVVVAADGPRSASTRSHPRERRVAL